MNIIATIHNDAYSALAEKTWDNNRVKYAEKHGYGYVAKTEDFYGYSIGFEKIQFLIDLFDTYPDTEWILWTGTDSMVTNFDIRIEDKIVPGYDVILCGDFNFEVNADIMLIKNTIPAREWLKDLMKQYATYQTAQYSEQQCIMDGMIKYLELIKLMPQRHMNSYDYDLYKGPPWFDEKRQDVAGNDGQWAPGDWIIQWPGTQMNERMVLVDKYSELVQGN
jgi:hypothetical protein